jgi:hypothetical protein
MKWVTPGMREKPAPPTVKSRTVLVNPFLMSNLRGIRDRRDARFQIPQENELTMVGFLLIQSAICVGLVLI